MIAEEAETCRQPAADVESEVVERLRNRLAGMEAEFEFDN
jgi:hypothetical protein